MKTIDWLDIVFAVLLVILAIKWFPLLGLIGSVVIVCAAVKIGASVGERHR